MPPCLRCICLAQVMTIWWEPLSCLPLWLEAQVWNHAALRRFNAGASYIYVPLRNGGLSRTELALQSPLEVARYFVLPDRAPLAAMHPLLFKSAQCIPGQLLIETSIPEGCTVVFEFRAPASVHCTTAFYSLTFFLCDLAPWPSPMDQSSCSRNWQGMFCIFNLY